MFEIIALAGLAGAIVMAALAFILISKDKPFMLPYLGFFLCIIVFAGASFLYVNGFSIQLGGRSDDSGDESSSRSTVSSIGSAASGSSQNDEADKKDNAPEKTAYGVGEKAKLNGVTVTLDSVVENNGKEFFKPDDGNVYVLCEFTIENNSDEELAVSSVMCFDGYVDDYSTSLSIGAESASDKGQLDGTVAVGKKMNGVIGYEVASGWKEIEIHFNPDFWNRKDIVFFYKK